VRVTRALRTIMDLLRSGPVDPSQLELAVDEAMRRGVIGIGEIDRMPTRCLLFALIRPLHSLCRYR
jgi:hypothetical protein